MLALIIIGLGLKISVRGEFCNFGSTGAIISAPLYSARMDSFCSASPPSITSSTLATSPSEIPFGWTNVAQAEIDDERRRYLGMIDEAKLTGSPSFERIRGTCTLTSPMAVVKLCSGG